MNSLKLAFEVWHEYCLSYRDKYEKINHFICNKWRRRILRLAFKKIKEKTLK